MPLAYLPELDERMHTDIIKSEIDNYPLRFSCGFTTFPAAFMAFMASFQFEATQKIK